MTMWVFENCLTVLLVQCVFGEQHQYTVFQENMVMSDIDHRVMDITGGVYPINETTNVLNITFTLKISLPDDCKMSATFFKWIHGDYRLGLVNIYKSVQSALQMEMFDLQALFIDHCRPPMVWPFAKGVRYSCFGWSPDSTRFPPNLPGGRMKVPITVMFANNTKFVVATWYLKFIYKK